MLIELRVQNHRSIFEEQVFTMEAASIGDAGDVRPRAVAGWDKPVLPAAALYGANASGKSNLLFAFLFMRDAVALSHRAWAPDGGVGREPFAFGGGPLAPSVFEVVILIEGVRYQYGFAADDERFLEEWLYAWPKNRKQVWFERDGQKFKFGDQLRGENKVRLSTTYQPKIPDGRTVCDGCQVAGKHGGVWSAPIAGWRSPSAYGRGIDAGARGRGRQGSDAGGTVRRLLPAPDHSSG